MKLTIAQAAEFLECSEARVYECLRQGLIPGLKLGQSWVIPERAFYEVVNALAVRLATLASDASRSGPPATIPPVRAGRKRLPRSTETI